AIERRISPPDERLLRVPPDWLAAQAAGFFLAGEGAPYRDGLHPNSLGRGDQVHRRSRTPLRNSAWPRAFVAACLYSFTSASWVPLAKLRSFGSRAISALATAGSRRPRPSSTG